MRNSKKRAVHVAATYLSVTLFVCIAVGSERWYHLKSSFLSSEECLLGSSNITDVAVINGYNGFKASLLVTTQDKGMFRFSYSASLSAVFHTLPDSLINWNKWERYSPYRLDGLPIHSLAAKGDTLYMGSEREGVIRALKTGDSNRPDFSLTLHSEGLPAGFTLGHYSPIRQLEATNGKFFALADGQLFSSSPSGKIWKKEQVPAHEGYFKMTSFHAKGNTICCWTPYDRESINTLSVSGDAGESWHVFDANELIGLPSDSIVGFPIQILCTTSNTILVAVRILSKQQGDNASDRIIFLVSHDAGHTWSRGDTVIIGGPHISLTGLNGRLFMSITNTSFEGNLRIFPSNWKSGIYVSDNNGKSWQPFSTGMTDTLVKFIKACNGKLIAATLRGNIFLHDPLLMYYLEEEWEGTAAIPRKSPRMEEGVEPEYLFPRAASRARSVFLFKGSGERILDLKGRLINAKSPPGSSSQRLPSSQMYIAR